MRAILLIFAMVALAGCKKDDDTGCYNCTMTTVTTVSVPTPGYPQTQTASFSSCDGNKSGVETATVSQGGISATSTATTTCIKK